LPCGSASDKTAIGWFPGGGGGEAGDRGVENRARPRLSGHSDAYVGITPARCPARRLRVGDIGECSPTPRSRARLESIDLLALVMAGVRRGANVDVTVICEEPTLDPYKAEISSLHHSVLSAPVSVKASDQRRDGRDGRGVRHRGNGVAMVGQTARSSASLTSISLSGWRGPAREGLAGIASRLRRRLAMRLYELRTFRDLGHDRRCARTSFARGRGALRAPGASRRRIRRRTRSRLPSRRDRRRGGKPHLVGDTRRSNALARAMRDQGVEEEMEVAVMCRTIATNRGEWRDTRSLEPSLLLNTPSRGRSSPMGWNGRRQQT